LSDFSARPGAAVVAGGSGAIGAAIARMLAERGSDVVITFRSNTEAAAAVVADVERSGRRAQARQVDLVDAGAALAFLLEAADLFDGVHTLVHAAGPHVPMLHLSRVEPERFRWQLEADAVAFFNLAQPALPLLRAATRRFPIRDGLSAGPKGAVEAVVRGLAAEEGRYGVRANCVGPGMLIDGMAERLIASGDLDERALETARNAIPLRRFGTAQDIAELVCFLASDRAAFVSGQMIDVDGGYAA